MAWVLVRKGVAYEMDGKYAVNETPLSKTQGGDTVIRTPMGINVVLNDNAPIPKNKDSASKKSIVPAPLPLGGDVDTQAIALVTELCKLTERLEQEAYPDPVNADGLPVTIGYGSTKDRNGRPWRIGDWISVDEANWLLTRDVAEAYWPMGLSIPYWQEMNAHQRAALASLRYNSGYLYMDDRHDTLDSALAQKAWEQVGIALQLYDNNDQLGLSRRRYAEWLMFSQSMGPKEAYFTAWAKNSVSEIMRAISK